MKTSTGLIPLLLLAVLLVHVPAWVLRAADDPDRTLSPYFLVESEDPSTDVFPLKETAAEVRIAGVIADVVVTQTYANTGEKPIEATYIFPASTRAAVHSMKMTIGERTIVAEIRKTEEAREEYAQAVDQGKSASLLEQKRPNVFQMKVGNILPGDEIRLELRYTEVLVPTGGKYEFVYPTVVGPRYSNVTVSEAPEDGWVETRYLKEGEEPPYTLHLDVRIAAGMPIDEIGSPSHRLAVNYDHGDLSRATVTLDKSERRGGNRDFVLTYRISGDDFRSGLLLHEGAKENYFLLMIQPPRRIEPADVLPREYVFIMDVSGSMRGFPLEVSKRLLTGILDGLRPEDMFNVVFFSGNNWAFSEVPVPATRENIELAKLAVERERGGGGTEILSALRRAFSLHKRDGYSRTVVIATDGYVRVEREVFDLIRESLGEGNVFTFGIGKGVNRYLIEGMARAGMGHPFVVGDPERAEDRAEEFKAMIEAPLLTDVRIDYGDFEVYDVEPGNVPDVFSERPITVFGKWRGEEKGRISLQARMGDGRPYAASVETSGSEGATENPALRYLWARHRVASLSDYAALADRRRQDDGVVKEITALGLEHSLLTAHTSFVAVDSRVRLEDGKAVPVTQVLPLPQGVPNTAVGRGTVQACTVGRSINTVSMNSGTRPHIRGGRSGDITFGVDVGRLVPAESLSIHSVVAKGGLIRTEVEALVEARWDTIRRTCVRGSLRSGMVVLEIVLDADGKPVSVSVTRDDIDDEDLARCLRKAFGLIDYPRPAGSRAATITVTLEA
jgi:Ca-activated chloride channel family protein